MMKQPAKIDVAVLMLFFNRPETFRQAFEAVKAARPSRLFLYQDGPREGNETDRVGMEACRRIASDENIDWECDVQRHYCEHNQGCDPSGYLSQRWAFSMADKVAVVEDDVVVAPTFLPFCKEMLDRYEHDDRITMVAGFNTDEVTPVCPTTISSHQPSPSGDGRRGGASSTSGTAATLSCAMTSTASSWLTSPKPAVCATISYRCFPTIPQPESLFRECVLGSYGHGQRAGRHAYPKHGEQRRCNSLLHPLCSPQDHATWFAPYLHHGSPRCGLPTAASDIRHGVHALQRPPVQSLRLGPSMG